MGFIVFLIVAFLLVIIIKSGKRKDTVTRIDPNTGERSVETIVTNSSSFGGTVFKVILSIIVIFCGFAFWGLVACKH